jgi:hypothetical protein
MTTFRHLKLCVFIFALMITLSNGHKMANYSAADLLDPVQLRPFMFKTEITGQPAVMVPFKQHINSEGQVTMD